MEQFVIRIALKGGDANQVTRFITQAVEQEPDGIVSKVIANTAKQSGQFNNAIDMGAGKVTSIPLVAAFEQMDLNSVEICCSAAQPTTAAGSGTGTPTTGDLAYSLSSAN